MLATIRGGAAALGFCTSVTVLWHTQVLEERAVRSVVMLKHHAHDLSQTEHFSRVKKNSQTPTSRPSSPPAFVPLGRLELSAPGHTALDHVAGLLGLVQDHELRLKWQGTLRAGRDLPWPSMHVCMYDLYVCIHRHVYIDIDKPPCQEAGTRD